jgi:hypothetical protein
MIITTRTEPMTMPMIAPEDIELPPELFDDAEVVVGVANA